jgi:hypothetical protein
VKIKILNPKLNPIRFAKIYFIYMDQSAQSDHLVMCFHPYEHPKFWDNKSPNLRTPIWEFREKMPFGCSPHRKSQSIL